jgi:hypothetical protein
MRKWIDADRAALRTRNRLNNKKTIGALTAIGELTLIPEHIFRRLLLITGRIV